MSVHGGNIEEVARMYKFNPEEIVDFSANINPMGLSENVKKAMINSIDKVIKYPDITYFDLKNSISNFEDINSQNIILGNGAAEAIFNIVRALKPKKALLPAPTFSEYEEAILSVNGEIKYYKLKEKNNFEIDNEFIDNIKDDIDVVFICNPNNPTGVLTTNQFIIKVLKKALITNTIIVIDESFLDFMETNNEYSSKGLLNYYDNLIVVKSLTKFFAIPGARIGYGLCKNNVLINEINKVTVPWSINIIAADAIIQGLKEKDYINNSIKYVKDEKECLYRALKEIQVLKVLKPSVNFIMFKLLIDLDLKGELIKRKILIRSCSNYIGLNENFYRIAVRTSEENKIIINEIRNILFDK